MISCWPLHATAAAAADFSLLIPYTGRCHKAQCSRLESKLARTEEQANSEARGAKRHAMENMALVRSLATYKQEACTVRAAVVAQCCQRR